MGTYELRYYGGEQYARQGDDNLSKTIFSTFFRLTYSWNDPSILSSRWIRSLSGKICISGVDCRFRHDYADIWNWTQLTHLIHLIEQDSAVEMVSYTFFSFFATGIYKSID